MPLPPITRHDDDALSYALTGVKNSVDSGDGPEIWAPVLVNALKTWIDSDIDPVVLAPPGPLRG
jgi:hypothetical protein